MNQIKLRALTGTYSIRAAGAVLGESSAVMEVSQGDASPILFVPRRDLAMAFFDETDQTEDHKDLGTASLMTLQAKSGPIHRAAWFYQIPPKGFEDIAHHLSFDVDKITVEQT